MGYPTGVPLEYAEFQLVREMGWTYRDLERTSAHRVAEAMEFLRIEAKHRHFTEDDRRRH